MWFGMCAVGQSRDVQFIFKCGNVYVECGRDVEWCAEMRWSDLM